MEGSQVVEEMVINNVNSLSNLYSASATVATRYANTVGGAKELHKGDKLTLSTEAQSFSEMLGKLQSASEVRQDKVDEFERKIANGTYNVAAENIAASILTSRF